MNARASLVVLALSFLGCAGPAGPTGAEGPAGAPGPIGPIGPSGAQPASVSAITPLRLFLGRSYELAVSGSDTQWTSAATIDFGAGITVDSLTVASPTGLVAKVTVAQTAAVGPRTVTVTEGSEVVRYAGAVHVDSPLKVTTVGTVAQGSFVSTRLEMLDVTTPFDATTEGDGMFTPITYSRLQLTVPDGGVVLGFTATPTAIDLVIGLDTQIAAAPLAVSVASGPTGSIITSVAPAALNPTARAATPLTVGTPGVVTTTSRNESQLYSVPGPAVATLFQANLSTSVVGEQRTVVLLPASGSWANLITAGRTSRPLVWASPAQAPWYLIAADGNAVGMYTTTLTATVAAASAQENTASTTFGAAQVVSALPFLMFNATATSASYEHWLKVPVLAGDVGKHLRVRTLAGDQRCDPVIDVYLPDGTTSFAQSNDNSFHEDLLTPVIATAGDYVVKITVSTASNFDPSQVHYDLFVGTE